MSEYGPPKIDRLEPGDQIKTYYISTRSGNEVDRKGTVAFTTVVDGTDLYWVHGEQKSPLKHQYHVLAESEYENGDPAVVVTSATLEAEDPTAESPPQPGERFSIKYEIARRSHLGAADRVMKDGVNINVEL